MEAFRNEEIAGLLGDFYQAHANENREVMEQSLMKMQNLLYTGEADSTPFKDYFNSVFGGRTPYNTSLSVSDYPKESIIRELLQNTFGCYYSDPDIKVLFNFEQDGEVRLTYNEDGFTLEQILYYLSIGRSDGDKSREGRFGVGSKSVFMNVEWLKLRSNNFNFRIVNDAGILKIRELNLTAPVFKGTEIVFKVSEEEQAKIKENLVNLTIHKGEYINLVEFCFAFIRKKQLGRFGEAENPNRTFNVAVMDMGKPLAVYKVIRYQKTPDDDPTVRFLQNGKSVIEFIWHENEGFVYLIPFAVSSAKRDTLVKVLLDKYNYFSTYELTGLIKSTGEDFIKEKLSAFFISVPNSYITTHRTGIRHECEEEVSEAINRDLKYMIEKYSRYFVIELLPRTNSDKYYMRPKHYVFEFFSNYLSTSVMVGDLRSVFHNSISLLLPGKSEAMPYSEVKELGFFSLTDHVSKQEHENGSAFTEYIEDELVKMRKDVSDMPENIIMASYKWVDEDSDEEGREFCYNFNFDGNTYVLDSERNPAIKDFDLSFGFRSIVSLKLGKYVINDAVADEDALIGALGLFDTMYGQDYKIGMRYFQFNVHYRDITHNFDVARMTVHNLKRAYDCIVAHKNSFENHQIYNEVINMLINSFTQGKDTMTFLREMKSQGSDITLQLDINKKFRFAAYGKQFMIPSSITNADLLEIIGDVYALINCGMFNGRVFDFPFMKSGYSFEKASLMSLLRESNLTDEKVSATMPNLYICDLKIPRIALLGEKDKIIRIIDINDPISDEERQSITKYVILRDDCTKPEFAKYVEYLLVGENNNVLSQFYSSTEEPNQVLLDQIPYYYKPLPSITAEELQYLRTRYKSLRSLSNLRVYRNYFAKDINGTMFGYGGTCSCCGFESSIINNYVIKSFEVGLFKDDREEKFKFSLYMCANDSYAASGWIIEDISIGGMSPFVWLDEIASCEVIPPEFLLCSIKYRCQLTYDIIGSEGREKGAIVTMESVSDGEQKTMDIILSPLMMAKWIEDNLSDEYDTAESANSESNVTTAQF